MSRIFKDITLTWKGEDYTVPADKVMELLGVVEEHVVIEDCGSRPKRVRISKGFAAAIRYAASINRKTVIVDEEEVYDSLFAGGPERNAVYTILMMAIPPGHLQGKTEALEPEQAGTKARSGATASSKKRTS